MESEDAAVMRVASGPRAEPGAPLRSYIRAKQAVADVVRDVQRLRQPYTGDTDAVMSDLLSRLAEDRFQLAVVGQFARGKSTLINAIVGRPLLPVGALPVTSVVTSLRHGVVERTWIEREGQRFPEEIPLSELPRFVTEPGNPGNQKRVLSAAIEVPASFLRRGLRFIDTPGVGSAHTRNTATTLAFLPEADAVVFVTAADAPLSEFELGFLDVVREHLPKFFFVLNKIDQLDPAARAEATAFVQRTLAERLGSGQPRVFPLPSSQALAARTRHDPAMLAASGLPALEEALAQFPGQEHEKVFLVAVLDRALKGLDHARFMADLRRRATMRPEIGAGVVQQLRSRLEELDAERRRAIESLRNLAKRWRDNVLTPALVRLAGQAEHELNEELRSDACWRERRDVPVHRGRLCPWLDERLAELAGRAITELEPGARRVAEALASEAQRLIAPILARSFDIAADLVGARNVPARLGEETWSFTPPSFQSERFERDTRAREAEREALIVWAPRLARALTLRRLRRRLPEDVAAMLRAVGGALGGYVDACVGTIDVASAASLSAQQERIEAALAISADDDLPLNRPAPTEDQDLDSARYRLMSLTSALLRNEPAPAEAEPAAPATAVLGGKTSRDSRATAAEVSDVAKPAAVDPSPDGGPSWGRRATCPICAQVADAVFDFLTHYQYAMFADRETRTSFAASGDLCPSHTWELEELSSPRGLCGAYPPLLERVGRRLQELVGLPPPVISDRVAGMVPQSRACSVCGVRRSAEERAVAGAVARLNTATGRSTFETSRWLCLLHLRPVVARLDPSTADAVIRREGTRFIEVAEAMEEYGLKLDARRRSLVSDEESRAYREALVLVAAEKRLY
jgi:hypothetical protein